MKFPSSLMDETCSAWGGVINDTRCLPSGLDGVCLLQALADNESSYGRKAVPRHEKAYDWGGRYLDKEQFELWGSWSAHSYGPFQVMWTNVVKYGPECNPWLATIDPSVTAEAATKMVLRLIVPRHHGDKTIEDWVKDIGWDYNAGSHSAPAPIDYMSKLLSNYQKRVEQRFHHGSPGAVPS